MREFLIKDLGWKLLSVALAAIIWVTVKTVSKEPPRIGRTPVAYDTRTFTNLPIVVLSAAADVRAFKVAPAFVNVTVGGRPEAVSALTEREIHPMVDLTGIESASSLRKRVDVSTPPGITFIGVQPSQVDVMAPP